MLRILRTFFNDSKNGQLRNLSNRLIRNQGLVKEPSNKKITPEQQVELNREVDELLNSTLDERRRRYDPFYRDFGPGEKTEVKSESSTPATPTLRR